MMWSSLLSWAQRQFWQEAHGAESIPPLPFLPPSPSSGESTTAQDVVTTATSSHNGIFFERLSPDLRRMILIEAFGDRAVHMDLRYDRPLRARSRRKTMPVHAGGVDILYNGNPPSRDSKQPRAWRYYSCVCHRDPVGLVDHSRGAGISEDLPSHPATDSCLCRRLQSCDRPPGDTEDISRCFLGVMGWLLSCREA